MLSASGNVFLFISIIVTPFGLLETSLREQAFSEHYS